MVPLLTGARTAHLECYNDACLASWVVLCLLYGFLRQAGHFPSRFSPQVRLLNADKRVPSCMVRLARTLAPMG